jgi:predicted RNase H-like HicB family nuclease
MRYAAVIETGERNFSAYVPDLPGCVAAGGAPKKVKAEIREAIEFHLEGMREDGLPIPKPSRLASRRREETPPLAGTIPAMTAVGF